MLVGAIKLKLASPTVLFKFAKPVITGFALVTVIDKLILPPLKFASEACVAVIVAVPTPTTVTVDPLIVATFASLELYVNNPVLLLVGAVKLKLEVPYTLVIFAKPLIVGFALFTVTLKGIEVEAHPVVLFLTVKLKS